MPDPGNRVYRRERPASPPTIREDDLVLIRPARLPVDRRPVLALPGDGRLTLNTAAVYSLSPDKPFDAIRLYLSERGRDRYLVVRIGSAKAPDSVRIHRTGTGSRDHWPVVMMARAAGALRQLGLVERCKFVGVYDKQHKWLAFDLKAPQPFSEVEGTDPMGEAFARWVKSAARPQTLRVDELFAKVAEAASAASPEVAFPFKRPGQLAAYLHEHADEVAAEHGLTIRGHGVNMVCVLEAKPR